MPFKLCVYAYTQFVTNLCKYKYTYICVHIQSFINIKQYVLYMRLDVVLHLNKCDLTVLWRLILFAFLYYTSGYLLVTKKKIRAVLLFSKWKWGKTSVISSSYQSPEYTLFENQSVRLQFFALHTFYSGSNWFIF